MQFGVLGSLEARDAAGRLLHLGGGRQRKLLAILLVHAGEAVSTDRLIDDLWGEDPPPTAMKALQGHVSQLRKVLGRGALVTQSPGYVLRIELEQTDAGRFERLAGEAAGAPPARAAELLREALGLWRGPAFAEFAFEDFARGEIARLEGLRQAALEDRIEADLALGRHADLVAELKGLVTRNPHRERLRGQLMLALYRCGRQAEALEAYQEARRALVGDLGLEPGEGLRQLQRAVLAHDPAIAPPPPRAAPDGARRSAGRARRLSWGKRVAGAGTILAAAGIAVAVLELTEGSRSSPTRVTANSVAVIDEHSGRLIGEVAVGAHPEAVAVGEGSLWVANGGDRTVSRIDLDTREVVSTIGVGADVTDVAVGFGSVWVAGGNDGTLTRIDPNYDAVQAHLSLGGRGDLGPQPVFSVAAGAGSVWVTLGNFVLRIDPETNKVTKRIRVEPPLGLEVGEGSVWVTTTLDHVLRIHPRSGRISGAATLREGAIAPTFVNRTLWMIVGFPGTLWRLDPNTLETVGTAPSGAYTVGLASGRVAVWAVRIDGKVFRMDSKTGHRLATLDIGRQPAAVAVAGGKVWVAVGAAT